MASHPKAVIFGCAGTRLTEQERAFFRAEDPLGFILFARNCETPDQVRELVDELRASVGRPEAPVLIDQEGGRVQRLKPPHWAGRPPQAVFGRLAGDDRNAAYEAAKLNAALIGADLRSLGIDVDCLPLLDVPQPNADDIIGDRAFGVEPDLVADLGRAVIEGLIGVGVTPIIKHIPGHGRATVDSHLSLPTVSDNLEALRTNDFAPFAANKDAPWAMTAHIVFEAVDPDYPATLSETVVREIIRGELGFDGFLITDDMSMKALSGDIGENAECAIAAGCDLVLHCNGEMPEMTAIAHSVGPLSDASYARFERGRPVSSLDSLDYDWTEQRVSALISGYL